MSGRRRISVHAFCGRVTTVPTRRVQTVTVVKPWDGASVLLAEAFAARRVLTLQMAITQGKTTNVHMEYGDAMIASIAHSLGSGGLEETLLVRVVRLLVRMPVPAAPIARGLTRCAQIYATRLTLNDNQRGLTAVVGGA